MTALIPRNIPRLLRPLALTLLAFVAVQLSQPAPLEGAGVDAVAHEPGQSYMFLRVHQDSVVVRLEILAAELNEALGLGWTPTNGVTATDLEAVIPQVRAYLEDNFGLAAGAGGPPMDLRFVEADVRPVGWGDFILMSYVSGELEAVPDELEITFTVLFEGRPNHRDIVVIEHNWKTGTFNNEANISLIMSPRNSTQVLDLTKSTVLRGFLAMVWQGVWHILIGIDHILFVIALILPSVLVRKDGEWEPASSFRAAFMKLVAIVTFFTIAHSITLSMAAFDVVRVPSRFVESVIAASIGVAAAANLMPKLTIREWSIAFAFGLFHGFGFASVLGDIGLAREFLVLTLLGFNVGVELGQIAIIALTFPLLFLLRKTALYNWIFKGGSVVLILVASLWVVERVFDFNVPLIRIAKSLIGA